MTTDAAKWQVIHGDSAALAPCFGPVDSIVTDPPYGICIAGWDHGIPPASHWLALRSISRVGGYLAAFAGARTWHRMTCEIEDAGWEILADTALWVYGTGYPKGIGCLKPAFEPIIIARNGPGMLQIEAAKQDTTDGRWPTNLFLDEEFALALDEEQRKARPARFFYVAKPSTKERNMGLDGPNPHPTVKSVALMRQLVRLLTPSGGLVLDPFCGSGTTGIAAVQEGFRFLGVDSNAEYVEVARKRIVAA